MRKLRQTRLSRRARVVVVFSCLGEFSFLHVSQWKLLGVYIPYLLKGGDHKGIGQSGFLFVSHLWYKVIFPRLPILESLTEGVVQLQHSE